MTQPETSLLRSIWEDFSWKGDVLAAFDRWVQEGASRTEAKSKLKAFIEMRFPEQAANRTNLTNLNQINWDQVVEFLCTCFYWKRLRSPLPDIPSDDMWIRLTERENWGPLSLHPQQEMAIKETVPVPLVPLEQKLLALGGTRMIYRYEPDLALLLRRGELFDEPTEVVPGDPGQCHLNVARLWHEQRETLAIVTGYALSANGIWRQHSWLRRKNPASEETRLIETTMKRVKYFGVLLTEAEAEAFYNRA
jgi:hypothetical protein